MAEKEPREEKKLWGEGGSCGNSTGLAAMGLPDCWDICHLSRLELVIQQSSFSSSFFVIQTDRAFLWLPYRINFRSDARGYSI